MGLRFCPEIAACWHSAWGTGLAQRWSPVEADVWLLWGTVLSCCLMLITSVEGSLLLSHRNTSCWESCVMEGSCLCSMQLLHVRFGKQVA